MEDQDNPLDPDQIDRLSRRVDFNFYLLLALLAIQPLMAACMIIIIVLH